jgi:tRNA (cytidine/uridine-2'-O-)-methyltransferase
MSGSSKHDHLVGYERSSPLKLRVPPVTPCFRVVLVEPEIPPNTGSVARTCAATGTALHLVEPLGFRIDERSVRRAGIDYWHLVDVHVHPSFEDFEVRHPGARLHLLTANAGANFFDAEFAPGDVFVFGRESVGLPSRLLDRLPDRHLSLPTSGAVRSLNLSNAVSIAVFEALRQVGGLRGARLEGEPVTEP